jgi:SAM-dependent methyltransferase
LTSRRPLSELLAAETEARNSTGWDLSFIGMRQLGAPLPWDYEQLAREALADARTAVDLGTGGAEVLLRITEGTTACVIATEQWGPNARLAHERLRPRGIPLVWCEAEARRMPFRDAAFDLVLDRHEALDPAEVDRVLAPGGTVLTQQVTSRTWPELRRYIPRATVFRDHDTEYPAAFRSLGYEVEFQRHDFEVAFPTLPALVHMLVVAPWTISDFAVERDIEALRALESDLSGPQGIVLADGRYLLRARKPSGELS